MQYMMMFYEDGKDIASREYTEASRPYWGAWMAYIQALGQSGIVVSGAGLQPPSTATTLRLQEGRRLVQDGPFADTKEQLGGYFIIEVDSVDTALDWAARAPCAASGGVEIRPVMPPMARS
jgi:hypothetical protein